VPNHDVHEAVGFLCGTVVAIRHARFESPGRQLVEAAGGALGGTVGAALPDILEPAHSPAHREFCHSVTAAAAVGSITTEALQSKCRQLAEHYHGAQLAAVDNTVLVLLYAILELLFRLLAGFFAGLQAGYISHLCLDACTPSCVPIICRGL
jgi:membrane-bound metal-dependent hydrolase YbcI (DUF457 family)